MANINIFGALDIPDTDYTYLHTYGQSVVYDATLQALGDHNDDMMQVQEIFLEDDTKDHQIKYKLPGTGRLQRRGPQSRAGEVKAVGEWTVGFPLEDFGAGMAISDVDWGYMTSAAWNRHVQGVMNQDRNAIRFEILKAIFNNTVGRTFVDPNWGNLTIQPLANNDGVVYPPVIGSEVNATGVNHYLGVPAAATTITDANNPIPKVVETLEQHFGTPTGGSEIVVFCNNAQTNGVRGLAGFDTVPNRFVTYGANVSLVEAGERPPYLPGRVLGETDSALIAEWRWIPAGYLFGVHLGAPAPLMKRIDPPETGLKPGLQMVAADLDYPFFSYQWRNRYGVGVGNRLNGVVIDLTAAGGVNTYTIPAIYQ